MKTNKFLLLTLIFSLMSLSADAYDALIDGVFYNINKETKEAEVASKSLSYTFYTLSIPSTITVENENYEVTSIADGVFYNCKDLITVTLPSSVTSIGERAFHSCGKLTNLYLPNSIKNIGNSAFAYCTSIQSITIPTGVTSISDGLFDNCTNLAEVNFGSQITSIGGYTFRGTKISSIKIPSSVVSIGSVAFENCNSLVKAEFESIEHLLQIEFVGYEANPLEYAHHLYIGGKEVTEITIPNTITAIGASAFAGASYITSIIIPESVTTIGTDAFYQCTSIRSIDLPSGLTKISQDAFYKCSNLQNINIPEGVTSIGRWAFYYCSKLSSAIIPSTVKSINYAAFEGCNMLTDVTCFCSEPPTIDAHSFSKYGNLHIQIGCLDKYQAADYWKNFSIIEDIEPRNLVILDSQTSFNKESKEYESITYTRNFANTQWNALYVPFSMQYEDWAKDFEVARLNDVHQFDDDEDGEIDRTVLEVITMKEGSATEPNTPYMIKAKEEGEKTITLTNATLFATEENSVDVTSWYSTFTFTGTYSTITDMATKGHYAMANGSLMQASSDAATLGAFRWYLDITDRNGNPAPLKANSVFLSYDDDETTEIIIVEANTYSNDNTIYTVSGLNVSNNKDALPKGLYISNGKKIIIK